MLIFGIVLFLYSMDAYVIIWETAFILAAILAPGIALTFALFPMARDVSWSERLGLGLVLGLVPQVILYFLTVNAGVPMTEWTTLGTMASVTAFGAIVWKLRSSSKSSASATRI
jgi:uncharacterized membrane protein